MDSVNIKEHTLKSQDAARFPAPMLSKEARIPTERRRGLCPMMAQRQRRGFRSGLRQTVVDAVIVALLGHEDMRRKPAPGRPIHRACLDGKAAICGAEPQA